MSKRKAEDAGPPAKKRKENIEEVTAYTKVASYEAAKGSFKKCLLLYSGGLDTSVMLKWIQESYECDVVALTIDIGQTADDLDAIRQKALRLGACDAVVIDAKDEFADEIILEAIKANADYQGGYALGCPLGRVIISKIAVREAEKYGCEVIAHGCTGKGNDQVRFEGYITTLSKKLKIIAPVREWGMGREQEILYAEKHGIEVKQKKDKPYSYDENMWANTGEGGEIENPSEIPPLDDILQWCTPISKTPDTHEDVVIDWESGKPVAMNGKKMKLSEIIFACNKIGAKHGVGVFHLIEDRIVGLKVRGIYENPAASMLIKGHYNIEKLVSTREENELKETIDRKWSYMTYGAKWYDPIMYHIHAFTNSMNKKVSGQTTIRVFKGNIDVVALSSPYSLFDADLATFEHDATFNQNSSAGFIELYTLAQRTAYKVYDYEANLGSN